VLFRLDPVQAAKRALEVCPQSYFGRCVSTPLWASHCDPCMVCVFAIRADAFPRPRIVKDTTAVRIIIAGMQGLTIRSMRSGEGGGGIFTKDERTSGFGPWLLYGMTTGLGWAGKEKQTAGAGLDEAHHQEGGKAHAQGLPQARPRHRLSQPPKPHLSPLPLAGEPSLQVLYATSLTALSHPQVALSTV
jgi:hypothetical protein